MYRSPTKPRREDLQPGQSLCDHCVAKCCRYFALPLDTPKQRKDFDTLPSFLRSSVLSFNALPPPGLDPNGPTRRHLPQQLAGPKMPAGPLSNHPWKIAHVAAAIKLGIAVENLLVPAEAGHADGVVLAD